MGATLLVETVNPREDDRQLIGGEVKEIGCYTTLLVETVHPREDDRQLIGGEVAAD